MKNLHICFFSGFFAFILFSCASTYNPDALAYKDISAAEMFSDFDNLFSQPGSAYRVTDVWISQVIEKSEDGLKKTMLLLNDRKSDNNYYCDATDFLERTKEMETDLTERLNNIPKYDKYNGHYTVELYSIQTGDFLYGFETEIMVRSIEQIPTMEQFETAKAEEERLRAEEEAEAARLEAEKKAEEARLEAERNAALDAQGKKIAEGYIYHGIDEVENNRKFFSHGALESGHAYLVSGFVVKSGGSTACIEYGDGLFFSNRSSFVWVEYADQNVKQAVIENGIIDFFGQTFEKRLTVVIAGGTGYLKRPVVLGLIEETE